MSTKEESIKQDYEDGFSFRQIGLKYGIPKSTVAHWAKIYGWQRKTVKSLPERIRPKPSDGERKVDPEKLDPIPLDEIIGHTDIGQGWDTYSPTDDFTRIRAGAYLTLDKAEQILALDDALSPRDLKAISGMLLDVKNVLHAVSPWEKRKLVLELDALARQVKDQEDMRNSIQVEFVDTDGAEI